jgi:drug/metabolite transporter (DMT)-like permease
MSASARGPGYVTLLLFALAVVLGGSNFLAVRLSNLALPPFWGAGLRFTLAGLGFVVLARTLRLALPRGRPLWLMAGYGVLSIAGFYALAYWALLTVTAGVAAVVMAVVPLATVLLAAAQGLERLRVRSIVGGSMAVAGIAGLALEPGRVSLPLGALAALLGAVLCVSQGLILGKRLQRHHPAVINAVALTVGAAVLLALSAAVGETWSLPRLPAAAWALTYLVTFGSIGLFLVMLTVIHRWTASASSYVFVLFPVATMLLEALLLREPITPIGAGAALVVMAGVWVGALAPERAPLARPPAPTDGG